MNAVVLAIPFALQAGLMGVDEFIFHRHRQLPRLERIGHPLDAASVIACYVFLALAAPSFKNLALYLGLCSLSSLFVTKDEFVHAKYCTWQEHFLHAFLFVVHPVAFVAAGWTWWHRGASGAYLTMAALIALFALYQCWYWIVWWPKPR